MIRACIQIPQSEHNQHRMRRAFGWLERSEQTDNTEAKFIFLWIAFNAAYGAESTGIDEHREP